MRITAVVLNLLLASSALCEVVLVPINARDVPGVNGSIWRSSLAVANHGDQGVYVGGGIEICGIGLCPDTLVLRKSTVYAEWIPYWVFVAEGIDSLTLLLRVQDVSHQAETWGTTIPTVRESDALAAPRIASLVDIPMTSEFRSLLRIYDFDREGSAAKQARVRIYAVSGQVLYDTIYDLVVDPSYPPHHVPRMATIPLWTIPELADAPRVRVEVEAVSAGLRFWAFASVTNNATQHVTVITP